jgi:hypothetical protein
MELGGSLPHSQESTTCPYPSQINPFLCPSHIWKAQPVSFMVGLRTYQHPCIKATLCMLNSALGHVNERGSGGITPRIGWRQLVSCPDRLTSPGKLLPAVCRQKAGWTRQSVLTQWNRELSHMLPVFITGCSLHLRGAYMMNWINRSSKVASHSNR